MDLRSVGTLEALSSALASLGTPTASGPSGFYTKTCRFFRELDEILGHRPASVPVHLLDTGSAQSEKEAENEGEFSLLGLFVRYFPVAMLCR